jgi:hypothetical protein
MFVLEGLHLRPCAAIPFGDGYNPALDRGAPDAAPSGDGAVAGGTTVVTDGGGS